MNAFFPNETKLVSQGKCPFCSKEVTKEEFRDELSFREFKISGMCQSCQDDFFNGSEED